MRVSILPGHDRGGRVSYRLALDNPGRLIKLAVLDIIPTYEMWNRMDHTLAMKVWHWPFLAQKYPMPEMLIEKAPIEYLDYKMASWTKAKDLSAFDPRALAHYHAFFSDPLRIHATCEDYRAGETTDLGHDEVDHAARNKITYADDCAVGFGRYPEREFAARDLEGLGEGGLGQGRSIPVIFSPRKTRTRPHARCLSSFALECGCADVCDRPPGSVFRNQRRRTNACDRCTKALHLSAGPYRGLLPAR